MECFTEHGEGMSSGEEQKVTGAEDWEGNAGYGGDLELGSVIPNPVTEYA